MTYRDARDEINRFTSSPSHPNNLEVYAGVRREDRQNAFKERQIDLIHVWREVNKLWQHGVELSVRKQYVNEVKGILLRLKNSVKPDLKSRIKKAEKVLNEFVEEMEEKGYWRVPRFFKRHAKSILLFAYRRLEGIGIPWHNNWMERLMGEIAKRMKNKWMSWSARGAKNLLNLLLKRYAEKERYESFIGKLVCKGYIVEVKFQVSKKLNRISE